MIKWRVAGKLNGKTIWCNQDGQWAIEREFERLCELSSEELKQWEKQSQNNLNGTNSLTHDSAKPFEPAHYD